jgi:hypothetical protein
MYITCECGRIYRVRTGATYPCRDYQEHKCSCGKIIHQINSTTSYRVDEVDKNYVLLIPDPPPPPQPTPEERLDQEQRAEWYRKYLNEKRRRNRIRPY